MARIRTIKPEFFTSEQIVECSTSARLLFIGLWCFCDDGGVHIASLKRLKMEVFPGDMFGETELRKMVDELKQHGLIVEYESEGQTYWHVTGWDRHQKIDRPTCKYPRPIATDSPNIRRTIVEPSPMPRDGMESNGMESNGEEEREAPQAASSASEVSEPKSKRFIKPSFDEVSEYCRERKNSIDVASFIGFYESNGWRVGRNPMKDWRAAVLTWERRDANGSSPNPVQGTNSQKAVIKSVQEELAERRQVTGGGRI